MNNTFNVVVYGSLSASGKSGLAFFNYRVAKYLYDKNKLHKVYCLRVIGKKQALKLPTDKIRTSYDHLPTKIKLLILRILGRYTQYNERYLSEKVFDKYVCSVVDLKEVDFLINLKPAVPLTTAKARSANLQVITLATVAHPEFIREQIKKVEAMYHIKDHSSYSNLLRISRLCDTFESSNVIIPQIGSAFICKTFTDRVNTEVYQLNSLGGIDTGTYRLKDNLPATGQPLKFVAVAQFNLKKGVPILLDAWRAFLSSNANPAELHLIGSIDKTTQKVINTHFSDLAAVYYYPFSRKVYDELPKYDVFVASSVSDLLPRTVIEAMACGLPVIVSTHCGASDLVEPEVSGFVYDPFDIAKLASLFEWFTENPGVIADMGKKGRARIENLNFHDFLSELLSFIEERNLSDIRDA